MRPTKPSWRHFLDLRTGFQDRISVERQLVRLLAGDWLAAIMLSRLIDLHASRERPPVPPIDPASGYPMHQQGVEWWVLAWSWWERELLIPSRTAQRTKSRLVDSGFLHTTVLWTPNQGNRLLWRVDGERLISAWYADDHKG